jgi:small subunit ribosomal protein S6
MRHYEIVMLAYPNQGAQIPFILERYRNMIQESGGTIHRCEDIGKLSLRYKIENMYKAHYVLLNIECKPKILEEIVKSLRSSDVVMRHLVVKRDEAVTEPSALLHYKEERKSRIHTADASNSDNSNSDVEENNPAEHRG